MQVKSALERMEPATNRDSKLRDLNLSDINDAIEKLDASEKAIMSLCTLKGEIEKKVAGMQTASQAIDAFENIKKMSCQPSRTSWVENRAVPSRARAVPCLSTLCTFRQAVSSTAKKTSHHHHRHHQCDPFIHYSFRFL